MTQYDYLLLNIEKHIATITINRPEKRNAMNVDSWLELDDAIKACNRHDDVRVIILTGAGDQAFVAGADIQWIHDRQPLDIYGSAVQDVLIRIFRSYKPVIAAVNGYALGGGCELITSCDIRIASERAVIGQPEINIGILPAGGGTQQLSRLVGLAKAKEMILTGDAISAEEAHRIGHVNHVVPHDQLLKEAQAMADKIASKPPVAVRMAKMAVNESPTTDLNAGLALEKAMQAVLFGTYDKQEGARAFLEKRKPEFKGE